MSTRLRLISIHLEAVTERGIVGRDIDFKDGLNLLRADNSSGKSTALNGIIFALGLEGMLSPSHRIPLPYAMTDSVAIDGIERQLVESHVSIIMENSSHQRIRVSRYAKHPQRDPNLVTVDEMSASGQNVGTSDYFVRRPGAAQNYAGFHRYFAEFVGMDLPRITRNDGSETLLYLETLFPYFFVEQKRGWSGIQARMPVHLGIRDAGRRSAEYILGLDSLYRLLEGQRVRAKLNQLEATWQNSMGKISEYTHKARLVIKNLPAKVSDDVLPTDITPLAMISGEWMELSSAIKSLKAEIRDLQSQEIPLVKEASEELEEELAQLETALQKSLAVSAALRNKKYQNLKLRNQVALRIEALNEDLQRHKDAQVLKKLGSKYAHSLLHENLCPTCHQELSDGSDISSHTMTSEESIKYINGQIDTFKSILEDHDRVISAISAREEGLSATIRDHRGEIRATRETLSSSNSALSAAAIERRLRVEHHISELEDAQLRVNSVRDDILEIQQEWKAQQIKLKSITNNTDSPQDVATIQRVQQSVHEQLISYNFTSVSPELIQIDPTSYRPVYEGFDLGFELSASDMIRLIWAYLFAFLEVGQEQNGRHVGLLILDEPRQQETAKESFSALLSNAASAGASGSQVIIATSEPLESLELLLGSHEAHIINLAPGEQLLRSIS